MSYSPPHAVSFDTLSVDTKNSPVQGTPKNVDPVWSEEELGNDTEISSSSPLSSSASASASASASLSPVRNASTAFPELGASKSLSFADNHDGDGNRHSDHGSCNDKDDGSVNPRKTTRKLRRSATASSASSNDVHNPGNDLVGPGEDGSSTATTGREARFIAIDTAAASGEDGIRRRRRAHSYHTSPRMRRLSCEYDSDTIFFRVCFPLFLRLVVAQSCDYVCG